MERRNKVRLIIGLCLAFTFPLVAQSPCFIIPEFANLDSLFSIIHQAYEHDEDDIERAQQFGWYKYSEKIDAEQFYEECKSYCVERVGEERFYQQFRFDAHAFKDDPLSEIFTIRFRYYPFLMDSTSKGDFVNIIFQSLDFINIHQRSYPENLPDCSTNTDACNFPIGRTEAEAIGLREVVKGREDFKVTIHELKQNFLWLCTATANGWYGETFTVDARTGEVGNLEQWRRID